LKEEMTRRHGGDDELDTRKLWPRQHDDLDTRQI
jgi:hypothetical protein